MEIILASGNPGKRREFDEILALYGATDLQLDIPDDGPLEVAETGRSYRANARLKAEAYLAKYSRAALGDDSGLSVDALGGAPGLFSARFGGPSLDARGRVALLLEHLRGVPPVRRGAHFVCVLYLAFPGGSAVVARGLVQGRIADAPRGEEGFGYDPVFLLPHLGCTMAELPPQEKHRLSHRGRAMDNLLRKLRGAGRI